MVFNKYSSLTVHLKGFCSFQTHKTKSSKGLLSICMLGTWHKWRPLTKWLDKESVSLATLFLLNLDVKETQIQIPTLPVSACVIQACQCL